MNHVEAQNHLFVHHKWFCWLGCNIIDLTSAGGTKYGCVSAVHRDHYIIVNTLFIGFIYTLYISVINLLRKCAWGFQVSPLQKG